MKSIRRSLLQWLVPSLLLAMLGSAVAVYFVSLDEADEVFDYHLKQMAVSLPERAMSQVLAAVPQDDEGDDDFRIQIWKRSGERVYASAPGWALARQAHLGFATVRNDHGDWRVYTAASDTHVVQVAHSMKVRDELAAGIAFRTIWPLLFLLPVVGCLVWYFVGRGLAPLDGVARALGERSPDALRPLPDAALPAEVKPLVTALNALLARLDDAILSQRMFVADAAHELRTPLAAVKLQVRLAQRAAGNEQRAAAFRTLELGIERAIHLVEQLLALARTNPAVAGTALARVDLAQVARDCVAEYAPMAAARHIDLGAIAEHPVFVCGETAALRALVGNLIDNATRYTPEGGRVDVEVRRLEGRTQLVVTDNGPGVPAEERERVFDRFYRGEGREGAGSGLGLAIVKGVASRHGAAVRLEAAEVSGLRAIVEFAGLEDATPAGAA